MMEDKQDVSRKRITSERKIIATKNSRKPTGPFVSPVLRRYIQEKEVESQTSKRMKFEDNFNEAKNDHEISQCHTTITTSAEYCNAGDASSDHLPSESDSHLKFNAEMELKKLQLTVEQKQETLHKLNLVKMYRKKNNLHKLQELINKWRNVSQEGVKRLLNSMNGETKPTMHQILNQLQISHELIHYSIENETFS